MGPRLGNGNFELISDILAGWSPKHLQKPKPCIQIEWYHLVVHKSTHKCTLDYICGSRESKQWKIQFRHHLLGWLVEFMITRVLLIPTWNSVQPSQEEKEFNMCLHVKCTYCPVQTFDLLCSLKMVLYQHLCRIVGSYDCHSCHFAAKGAERGYYNKWCSSVCQELL